MICTEIVGAPGVGKTTLARQLAHLHMPACSTDLSVLSSAITREMRDWKGSDRITQRLQGLQAVVARLPSNDRVIADGPIAWIGAIASRGGMEVAERLAAALPPIRIVHLVATPETIVARLQERNGARRHIEKIDSYIGIAEQLVEASGTDVIRIDTTDLSSRQVAAVAKAELRKKVMG